MRATLLRFVPVVLLVFGCTSRGAESAAGHRESAGAHAGDTVVTLVEPGEEPRIPLRYQFVEDRRATVFVDVVLSKSMAVGSAPMTVISTLPLRLTLDVRVLDVDPSTAAARVRCSIERVEVRPPPPNPHGPGESSRIETSSLAGLSIEGRITPRGLVHDTKREFPDNMHKTLRWEVEHILTAAGQVLPPLPTEPVGVGAFWRVTSSFASPLVETEQVTLITLVKRDKERVVLSVTAEQTAPPQRIIFDDPSEGVETELERFEGKSNGRSEVPFDLGAPLAETTLRTNAFFAVTERGERGSFTIQQDLVLKLSPSGAIR